MPSASSFTNKVRATSEGRNTKVEYKGGVAQSNPLAPISCSKLSRWVDTDYQEKSIISCNNNPKVVITNALAAIDSNGLVNVSWKTTSHYNSYVILYSSSGTILETKETDGYTRIVTFSTLLTSGNTYVAKVVCLNTTLFTNAVMFI